MKHWFKFIVKGADGTYDGTEFVKAETEQEAIAVIKDNWIDYPYTDNVEECTFEPDCLSYKEQDECIRKDAVEAFMADNCTAAEAERHIKNGSEAIKSSCWKQYVKDNDLRDGEGELISAEDAKKELGARSVMVDGEEYILLYVL
jgi:hypothetical protein